MKKVLPFAGWHTIGDGVSITPIPGYKTRIRGATFSVGPFASVSGPAKVNISGLVTNFEFGFGDGGIAVLITPSITDAVTESLDFGAKGVEGLSPTLAVEFSVSPADGDTLGAGFISVWGEYVEV